MNPTGYEPLNTLKPVADDIWIIDGPHIRFFGLPFSTRATVVRLANGDVWIHSPTQLTDALAEEVAALGPVRHLIAPSWMHYAYVGEWQARFPDAAGWAAPGVAERANRKGGPGRWDHILTTPAPDAWSDEIDQLIVRGSPVHKEAVFFHRASRTLILTDLIENHEPRFQPLLMRLVIRAAGVRDPDGRMARHLRWTYRDRAALKADVEQMIVWAPDRVIVAHGRWYDNDGTRELKRGLRAVLG